MRSLCPAPYARSTRHAHVPSERLRTRTRSNLHSSIGTGKKFAPSCARCAIDGTWDADSKRSAQVSDWGKPGGVAHEGSRRLSTKAERKVQRRAQGWLFRAGLMARHAEC